MSDTNKKIFKWVIAGLTAWFAAKLYEQRQKSIRNTVAWNMIIGKLQVEKRDKIYTLISKLKKEDWNLNHFYELINDIYNSSENHNTEETTVILNEVADLNDDYEKQIQILKDRKLLRKKTFFEILITEPIVALLWIICLFLLLILLLGYIFR